MEVISDEKKNEWIKAAFNILKTEWNQIDYYRINKFMYLVNQILSQIFQNLKNKKWSYKVNFKNNPIRKKIWKVNQSHICYNE